MRRKGIVAILIISSLLLGVWSLQAGSAEEAHSYSYKQGEVLVKFREVASEWDRGRSRGKVNGWRGRHFKNLRIERVDLGASMDVEEALKILRDDPLIEFAEPNWKVNFLARSEPDDPAYQDGKQWYLDTASRQGYIGTSSNTFDIDVDIDAPEAWGVMGSTFNSSMRVSVGVLDSGAGEAGFFDNSVGYIPNHEDLFNSLIFVNPNEWASGSDSDSNGFVDDMNGWNWIQDNNTPADSPTDPSAPFHGTLISGVIAAAWNNNTGIAGIGVDSLRVLPLRTEFLDEILEGIDYAISFSADGDPPVAVLNASWTIFDSQSLRDAIINAGNAGIVFVAAAGNTPDLREPNNDVVPVYPASYSTSLANVLSVAASDASGGLADFSHFGVDSVQIAAPGELIHSTYSGTNQYKSVNGTSFSAPIAASALGLIMAADPSLTPSEAIARLLNGGDFHARLSGLVSSQKRVNLAGALAPFNPYSDLVPLGTTRSIAMYNDSIGARYATFTNGSSSDPSVAVLVGDSASGWAVSPIRPGIATFTLSFSAVSDPVASYETGTWRVTGIAPFHAQLRIGDKVPFTSLLPGAPSWAVTDPAVGTIDGNGEFTALAWGQTQVVLSVNGVPEDNSGMIVVSPPPPPPPRIPSGGGGGCFIATAAYGSYDAPFVKMLRLFRDSVLLTSSPGRWFVDQYYRYSPAAAQWLENHSGFKPIARVLLMPLVLIAWLSLSIGPTATALILLSIMMAMIIIVHRIWLFRVRSSRFEVRREN
jgi:hypothetical protein